MEEADLRPLSFATHHYDHIHLLMPLYGGHYLLLLMSAVHVLSHWINPSLLEHLASVKLSLIQLTHWKRTRS